MAAALRRATKTFPAEFTGASGSKRLELPAVVRHMLNIQVILVLVPDCFFFIIIILLLFAGQLVMVRLH